MRRFSQSGCYLCFDLYRFPQSFESVCISVCWSLVFPLDLVALLFPWLVHSPVFPFSLDCAGVVCPLGFYNFIKFGDMLNNPSQVFQASSFLSLCFFPSLIFGFLLCDLWVCFRSFCRPLAGFVSLTDYLRATSAWIKDLDFTVCLQCVLFLVFLTHNLFSVGGLMVGHVLNIPTSRCLGAAAADTEALRWILFMWNMKHSFKFLLNL